jgi:hypothetical protein
MKVGGMCVDLRVYIECFAETLRRLSCEQFI